MNTRLGLRGRLTALVALGALLTLGFLVIAFNVLLRASLDADADRLLRSGAAAALEEVTFHKGAVAVNESADARAPEAQIWVYSKGRLVEHPTAPESVHQLAASLEGTNDRFAEDPLTDTRLYSVAIGHNGKQVGTAITGVSLEPYERSAHRALIASIIFAAVSFALIVPLARLIVTRALRPVARMTHEAVDWSEHDLDHRFSAGPPHDELTELAAAFDGMLDKLAESLRREQRFSAELSHELRTPLAAIVVETDLALRHERDQEDLRRAIQAIATRSEQMQRVLETLLAAARAEIGPSGSRMDLRGAIEAAIEGHSAEADRAGIKLSLNGLAHPAPVAVDGDAVERVLSPILENACRHAVKSINVSVDAENGAFVVRVTDDGPGVPPGEAEHIFEAGYRIDSNGAGLGLPLARRLARALGGDVTCEPADGGARFAIRLPRA